MSVASVGREVKSQCWVLNPQVSAAEHRGGFPVYSLTSSPECCGCDPPEPKLFHSSDASACCALIFSAPRTPHKVWAGCPRAHGALVSCWWLLCARDRQTNSTSSSSWVFFSSRSTVSSSILQTVGLYYFTHSHTDTLLNTHSCALPWPFNNADGFSRVTKEPKLWTGKRVLSIPLPSLEICQGIQKKAEDPHWLFQLRMAYWGWRKEDWVLEDHVKSMQNLFHYAKLYRF